MSRFLLSAGFRLGGRFLPAAFSLLLLLATPLRAATIEVDNESELAAAIDGADPGDTIQFQADITVTTPLPTVTKALTFGGGYLYGATGPRAFSISGATVVLGIDVSEIDLALSNAAMVSTAGDLILGSLDGLQVTIGGGSQLEAGGNTFFGYGAGVGGKLVVTGAGSRWSGFQLSVGAYALGVGNVEILDGGEIQAAQGFVGGFVGAAGATGTLTVDGAGSRWTAQASKVGFAGGNGMVVVKNGGLFDGALVEMASTGGSAALVVESSGVVLAPYFVKADAAMAATIDLDGGVLRASNAHGAFLQGFASGDVTLGAGGGVFDTNGFDVTVGAAIDGAGALTKRGAGTLTFSAANAYAGGTRIEGGTLAIDAANKLGAAGTAIAVDGGTLQTSGTFSIGRPMTIDEDDGAIAVASGTLTYTGVIGGSGALEKRGAGTLVLTNANTFAGAVTVSEGALQIGNGATGSITGDLVNNHAVVFSRTGTLDYAGDISGTGHITKFGSGTVTFSGALSYEGATHVSGGTLAIASPSVFASESAIVTNAMLRFEATADAGTSDITVNGGQVRFTGSSSAGSSTITTNTLGFAYFLGDASAGSATITNNGTSFTSFEGNATADDATIVLGPDAFVEITALTAPGIAIGSLGGAGNVHLGAKTLTVGGLNASTTLSGGIDGAGGVLVKTGTGTLTLGGESSYTGGTVVEGGVLTVDATDALGSGNATVDESVLRFASNAAAGARTITVNADAEVQFADTSTAAATTIVTTGNGVIDLTELTAGGTGIGAIAGPGVARLGNKTLTTGAANASTEFSGAIEGAGGALVKNGSGTLTLSGANTYTGGTTVSGGTLRVNNANGSGTGAGAVTIGAGATLGGAGAIGGSVVAQTGAITAPGNSIGTLTIGGDYTWNGSSNGSATQVFELNNAGNTSDRLAIGGAFTKGAGASHRFNFSGTGQAGRTYTLATFASTTFAAGDLSYENLGVNLTGTFALNGTTLTFSVVSSAPVITTTADVTFVEDSAGVLVDAGLIVTDPDSATLASATVSITADFLAGDVLELTGVAADVDADYDADEGVLTIVPTGAAPTVARWQALLRAVRFSNPSDALPDDGSRTVTFTVSDGALTSTPASQMVLVANRNDAPTISGGPVALTSIDEDTTSGSTVVSTILTAVDFADVDPDSGAGLVVTAVVGHGAWEYSTDGVTWNGAGSVSASAGLLLSSATRLRYVPDGRNGETATLTFRAWDESDGTASTNLTRRVADVAGDLTANDDASMFSAVSAEVTIAVTAVNDAPTLAGGPYALAGTTANVASAAVSVTTLLAGVTYADVDTGALKGIAVTAVTGNGHWQFSTNGTWTNFDVVSEVAALLLDGAAQVRYVGDGANAETATFTFVAWDRMTGVASSGGTRSTADTTTHGGTTAFSTGTAQATIAVSSPAPPDVEATIQLSNLVQSYDGSPKPVRVQTVPAGLATHVTYSGHSTPPTAIGRYGVVAWITESGYTGSEMATLEIVPPGPPEIVTPPAHVRVRLGEPARFSVVASGVGALSYQWFKNGVAIAGATGATWEVAGVTPADIAFYDVEVADEFGGRVTSAPATVELQFDGKLAGDGVEVLADVAHPNGNTYDQVLVTGETVSVRADPGQITRVSFIDLSDDIVQVEFSGAGVLTILLENASGPAAPVNYNQPTVAYMKGHATLAIAGADTSTNVMIFTVGRVTAVIQALFRDEVSYDGFADVARVMIASGTGRFGGVRSGNAAYFHMSGYAGLFAPGVRFGGPAYLSEISGVGEARAVFVTGEVADARITGGDLFQDNGRAVEVDGLAQLRFTAGMSSHGVLIPAQTNRGRLMRDGVDVTASLVAP